MGTFSFQVGDKTVDVEAPDEASALAAVRKWQSESLSQDLLGSMKKGPDNRPDIAGGAKKFDDTVRSVARGVPFGSWADELAAAGNTALSYPFDAINSVLGREYRDEDWRKAPSNIRERYALALEKERDRDKSFDEEHPYLSAGAKLGGAVAGGFGMVRAMPGAFTATSLPGEVGKGVITGSLIAGGHGLGMGENADERIEHGIHGAEVGALLGGLFPLAIRGGQALYGAAKGGLDDIMGNGATKVEREVAGLMQADDVTEDTLRNLDPNRFVAMNTSDNAGALGEQIARSNTEAGKKMVQGATAHKDFLTAGSDQAADQMTHRAMEQADAITNAGRTASVNLAKEVAQRLGAPASVGQQPGVVRSLGNVTALLGRGGGDWLAEVGTAIGNMMRAGKMDRNYMEAARMLMSSGPEVADTFVRIAQQQAANAQQAVMIGRVLQSLMPAAATQATEYTTGGRF